MKQEAARRRKQGCSPSAISRYLGSDATLVALPRLFSHRFNPLYRGTWFPTPSRALSVANQVSRFNPLYRGTWFPTRHTSNRWRPPSGFNPLYRGTWFPTETKELIKQWAGSDVSIRYIAVLGFQQKKGMRGAVQGTGFNPLYRGTWFPTGAACSESHQQEGRVSIRYIAVLGFQPTGLPQLPKAGSSFQSAISRYLVSN